MNSTFSAAVIENSVQLVLRISIPWYREVPVVAETFGAYNVQFAAMSVDGATRVHIAAFPVDGKKARDRSDRPICPLSGSFETQEEVIAAWENGFVVTALQDKRPPHLAREIVKYLLKTKQAEAVRV